MINAQMFKTVDERYDEFNKFCKARVCEHCPCKAKVHGAVPKCLLEWLELEYKEELKKCPFCGGEPVLYKGDCSFVKCHNCDAESFHGESSEEVIAAWNRRVS